MESVEEQLEAKQYLVHGIAWRFVLGTHKRMELDEAQQVAMIAAWKVICDDGDDRRIARECRKALIEEYRRGRVTGVKRDGHAAGDRPPTSLNRPVGGDEQGELLDFLVDDRAELAHKAVLERAQATHESAAVRRAMAALSERYRLAVYLHFFESLTLQATGDVLGVTESRASQIVTAACAKMRPAVARARA